MHTTNIAARVAAAFMVKNPEHELRGETIFAGKISEYEREVKRLQKEWLEAHNKAEAMPSGRAKGLAFHAQSQIGKAGKLARLRLEVAKYLKKQGLTKITFNGRESL